MKDVATGVSTELYTTEAQESAKRAEAEKSVPDSEETKKKFEELLKQAKPKAAVAHE